LLLLAFIIPLIFIKQKFSRKVSLVLSFVGLLFLVCLSFIILKSSGSVSFEIIELRNILHFDFFIDRLAALFVLIIALVSMPVIIYSWSYVEHLSSSEHRKNLLVALMTVFIISLLLIVTSANLLLFLFFWEIMAISSFLMMYHDYDKKETRKAGLYYFVMTSLSTTFLIIAFIMLYNATGSLSITKISSLSPVLTTLAFICLFLGFGIKSGIIPFHKWLPYAHPAAPSNISALMSGIMIKIAVYGLIRFVIFVLPSYQLWWGILILIAGTVSAILGVIYALKEHDIKRLLAYHSIENIGIIFIGFGLHIIFSFYNLPALAALSLAGALLHTLNHALFKSLLFLTAGSVVHSTKTKNIESMGGLIKTMPITAVLFLIGAVSISALPPFNGFISEFMIFQSFFSGNLIGNHLVQVLLVLSVSIFALTSALAATCFVKAFAIIFLGIPRSEHAKNSKEVPKSMLVGPAILAFLCIFIGIFSFQIAHFFGFSFDIPNMIYIGIFLAITFILLWIVLYNSKKIRVYETWSCGYCLNDGKTEYTASGFSQPIIRIFSPIFLPKITVEKKFSDMHQIKAESGYVKIELLKLFEERIYDPILNLIDRISKFILRFHQRDMDSYIAYVFIICLILMIVIGVL
jgi:hydrogenase-4 component B